MADYGRRVLDHYQLSTAYPLEWPAEKDLSDDSDEEDSKQQRNGMLRRSKSRYSALERVTSDRKSLVPGSQKTGNGLENLVQRDEPDPLGTTESVVRILRQLGLPVQDDTRLHAGNRFLLSSTTFSPALFLSQVHSTASTDSLIRGLDTLSRSIDQKSASLKVLVESNFERFVRAKATIDNVYTEMKYRGDLPTIRARPHSRHASRNSFRTSSGNQASMALGPDTKKKNALTKESEYGVLGIKTPLLDVSAKAEEVWGPALGGREKEESLKSMSTTVSRYKELYEVNGAITDCIRRKDYESLVEEYAKAKRFADDAKRLSDQLASTPPTDAQIHQLLLAARVWHDVEDQIEEFKKDVWRRLTAMQSVSRSGDAFDGQQDQHMELISILLELGVADNPIWVWLLSRYDYLKSKIRTFSERSRVEIEILRRRLAKGDKPTAQVVASHLRSLARQTAEDKPTSLDSAEIIELWEKMDTFLTGMLSAQGVLGEVMEFWQTVQSFVDGQAQKTLPIGLNGESRQHHRLSDQGTLNLQEGTVELVDMIRESIFAFFADPPLEDISSLFSPLPPTPRTPKSAGASGLTPTSMRDPRFNFENLPPPSPKRGEAWEKFAFWPPWSNSLSGANYLAKLLVLVGTGASEMASISAIRNRDTAALERLKALVGGARERCVTAICAAWNKDAENIKVLEDWRRSSEKRNLTRMPANFGAFESAVLSGMQKILYISEAKVGSAGVVFPPPAKLLQMVRSQFVTTLYKALSGMVENAEKSVAKAEDDWTTDTDGLASPVATVIATSIGAGTVNSSDRNVRMLLTLSNLQYLRVDIVPNLTTQFENAFSVKLTEEAKTIRDVLGQIDARLFQSYTRPAVENLRGIIHRGISAPEWAPGPNEKPRDVRPYIYEALLSLVLVHTQVSTTASSLTAQVLSYLLEQASRELLESFKQRQRYPLPSLMQATLDVEFVAQTLSQYTTDRASETQSQVYQELDKGTDNDARQKLQNELPEMRAVLKRLREGSRSEFACFKKARRSERPSIPPPPV
ncbi:Exocyst complex component SEC5 [Lachnellula cervina]|uniref:Exocyst complex component SEC5 n=1 Tax=Lachnellula cervina TaxID=1316786 RepID=A0A7D8Z1B2_9HELO|nr:Exocyst complex component SEC5 [Lachnellula cervina]